MTISIKKRPPSTTRSQVGIGFPCFGRRCADRPACNSAMRSGLHSAMRSGLHSAMRSGLHSTMRGLCSTPDTPVRIYRLNQIKMLRAMLRVKVIQLGGGVAKLLPSASIISNGGLPSLAEGSMVAAVVGGTLLLVRQSRGMPSASWARSIGCRSKSR